METRPLSSIPLSSQDLPGISPARVPDETQSSVSQDSYHPAEQSSRDPLLIGRPDQPKAAPECAVGESEKGACLYDPEESVAFLQAFNNALGLDPGVLKEKNALMKSNALSFFRAAPALFIRDMKGPFANEATLLSRKAPEMVIDGDMHIGNIGSLRAAEGDTRWGINDQDQAGIGSPEWDLMRFTTSLMLLREKGGHKMQQIVKKFLWKYCETLTRKASGEDREGASLSAGECRGPVKDLVKKAGKVTQQALLDHYATEDNGIYRFTTGHELRPVTQTRRNEIEGAMMEYMNTIHAPDDLLLPLHILDVAEKCGSGGSSYGLPRYWVLAAGSRDSGLPVILEIKQLLTPAVVDQSGDLSKADGRALVAAQKSLGGYYNPLTGFTRLDGHAYLVRERESVKDTLDLASISDLDSLEDVAGQAGVVLARAHGYEPERAKALLAWIGDDEEKLASALYSVSKRYAAQTEADYKAFCRSPQN